MSQFGKIWVRLTENPKRGEPVEIRAMVMHPMESGFRLDNVGRPIPRHIVDTFTCTYGGKQVFRAKLHPAMSANPYFVFYVVASTERRSALHVDRRSRRGRNAQRAPGGHLIVLVLGLLIFLGVHSVRIVGDGWRRGADRPLRRRTPGRGCTRWRRRSGWR